MDLREYGDVEDLEVVMFLEIITRTPRRFRNRPDYLIDYSDSECIMRFRLSKETFFDVLD